MSTTFKSHKQKRNFGLLLRDASERKSRHRRESVPWHSTERWSARAASIRNAIKARHESNLKKKVLREDVKVVTQRAIKSQEASQKRIAERKERKRRFGEKLARRIAYHVDRAITG